MDLVRYVLAHTIRGECKCGKCIDVGTAPDPAHAVDLIFFKVAAAGFPDPTVFENLIRTHKGDFTTVDPLDGQEHNYIELGAWLGDQGIALQFMALGSLLGTFTLLTPYTVLPQCPPDLANQMMGLGLLSIQRKPSKP